MSDNAPKIFDDESGGDRLSRKSKESPFMVMGLAGLVAAVCIGGYRFRHRGAMDPSIFFMHLRVTAQGTVVAALSIGILYSMIEKHILHKPQ